jgi:hypothetical protein
MRAAGTEARTLPKSPMALRALLLKSWSERDHAAQERDTAARERARVEREWSADRVRCRLQLGVHGAKFDYRTHRA